AVLERLGLRDLAEGPAADVQRAGQAQADRTVVVHEVVGPITATHGHLLCNEVGRTGDPAAPVQNGQSIRVALLYHIAGDREVRLRGADHLAAASCTPLPVRTGSGSMV